MADTNTDPPPRDPMPSCVPCEQCLKEIPPSEALSREADDYVLYFCGPRCHAEWEREQARETQRSFADKSGVHEGRGS